MTKLRLGDCYYCDSCKCFSETTHKYVRMFESIQRLPQMHRYYEHFHKSGVSKNWSELQEREDKSLPQILSLFYDTLVSTFHTQVSLFSIDENT